MVKGGVTMGIHDGHRQRLRKRFRDQGLNGFSETEALEMLLFYALPRIDTNPLAHELIDRFGSLDAVFSASERELCDVPGISEGTACLIRMIPQLTRLSEIRKASRITRIGSPQDAAEMLIPRFMYEKDEMFILLCLDSRRRVIQFETMSRGVVNAVTVDIRRIVETAIREKASSVILSHNHPDGPAKPSYEDDRTTRQVFTALLTVGIELYDHIIVSGNEYGSYREEGKLDLMRYPG